MCVQPPVNFLMYMLRIASTLKIKISYRVVSRTSSFAKARAVALALSRTSSKPPSAHCQSASIQGPNISHVLSPLLRHNSASAPRAASLSRHFPADVALFTQRRMTSGHLCATAACCSDLFGRSVSQRRRITCLECGLGSNRRQKSRGRRSPLAVHAFSDPIVKVLVIVP